MAAAYVPVTIEPLRCRICRNILRNPATVPCGHSFCLQCVEDSWNQKKKKSGNSPFRCPVCSRVFTSKPQLIRNANLEQMVGFIQSYEIGSRKRKLQDVGASIRRKEAGTREDKRCRTHELLICAKGSSEEHQGHGAGKVECERKRKQGDLKNMQAKFKEILQQQEKTKNDTKKIFQQIQEEARQTTDVCESVVAKVIDSLQKHFQSVKKLIEDHRAAAEAKVQQTLDDLETRMEEHRKRNAELDRLGQTKSDGRFLQEWASLQLLCEQCLLSYRDVSEDPLLPFELTKRDVQHLGNQLVEFCDKEFASVCQTAASREREESAGRAEEDEPESSGSTSPPVPDAPTRQKAEPETRAQFLQYACELTLNPDTAHDDLLVSEGGKEVKMKPPLWKPSGRRPPEKFLRRRQVLCREGLRAERCYYEVEVKGDKVEVGLAYSSIDRKSRGRGSAFGGNTVSWSLDRSTRYSVSHNSNSVQLTAPPRHPRVGVFLQFREGLVSFYEVDEDRMIFLYRVEARFTESLFPGFWLGEKSCIRICNLKQDEPHTT